MASSIARQTRTRRRVFYFVDGQVHDQRAWSNELCDPVDDHLDALGKRSVRRQGDHCGAAVSMRRGQDLAEIWPQERLTTGKCHPAWRAPQTFEQTLVLFGIQNPPTLLEMFARPAARVTGVKHVDGSDAGIPAAARARPSRKAGMRAERISFTARNIHTPQFERAIRPNTTRQSLHDSYTRGTKAKTTLTPARPVDSLVAGKRRETIWPLSACCSAFTLQAKEVCRSSNNLVRCASGAVCAGPQAFLAST